MEYMKGLKVLLEHLGIENVAIKKERTSLRLYIRGKENMIKMAGNFYPSKYFYPRKRNKIVMFLNKADNYDDIPAVAQTNTFLD